jgi:glycosyltransferase involved in cell wall biosynthesis
LHRVPLADIVDKFLRKTCHSSIRATDASFSWVDRRAARLVSAKTKAVIGREDACLRTFQKARERGILTIYQLPTAHFSTVRSLVEREADEYPDALNRDELLIDFDRTRTMRKQYELEAAQYILCPSSFVQRSVAAAGVPRERIKTIPLGVDTRWRAANTSERQNVFLYVGNISARKGVHRLLKAWKRLGAKATHRLRLVGDMHLPQSFLRDYQGTYEHVPRVPRLGLIEYYSSAQAFVFNAMADGFGHVFAEAMVCGTPVLASRNCGAPDLLTDGVEGRLFDFGDDDQLAVVLDWALSHPTELAEMGVVAQKRAATWGWSEFTEEFLNWLHMVLTKQASL